MSARASACFDFRGTAPPRLHQLEPDRRHALTPGGQEIAHRLVAERRASLARLCEGWAPEQHADLAGFLTRLADELEQEPPVEVAAGVEVGAAA